MRVRVRLGLGLGITNCMCCILGKPRLLPCDSCSLAAAFKGTPKNGN